MISAKDALNNYQNILNDIYGVGLIIINNSGSKINNIIGALANDQFSTFRENFISRLNRLQTHYHDKICFPSLHTLLKSIASSKNWQGAYSELIALDYFNYALMTHASFLHDPVQINISTEELELLGKPPKCKNESPILDGVFTNFKVYYDVKTLQSTSKQILQNVYNRVYEKLSDQKFTIVSEYDMESSQTYLSKHVLELEKELNEAIRKNPEITYLSSEVVDGLIHRIQWGHGVMITGGGYNPFCHAQNFWTSIFNDCHQFTINRPFLLVYAIFPWFNSTISAFRDHHKIFYRSVARRIFCGQMENRNPINSIVLNSKKINRVRGVTFKEASSAISGILFIEDESILGTKSDDLNAFGYLYMNPNAKQLLTKTFFYDYAVCDLKLKDIDTFECDNY